MEKNKRELDSGVNEVERNRVDRLGRMRLAAKCLVLSRKARRPSTKELSSGSQGQGGNTV